MMIRKIEQTWAGHGKKDCLEAIKQANRWLHLKKPGKFYDAKYALRSMHCSITNNKMVSWYNDGYHDKLCDFMDKLYEQIENMDEYDYYNIIVEFRKSCLI